MDFDMDEDQDDQNLALAFDEIFAEPEFVRAEKNLTAMGFFTPSSNKLGDVKSKTVQTVRMVDGKPVQTKVTIAPAALYGLPVTSDQDKYLALQKLIHDRRRADEEIVNPITFTTAELMRVMGREVRAGKNYDDVAEWMRRMTATTIVSEQSVYLAGRKAWASDTFHVFDRSVSFGKELPDGATADRNYIWLSAWQLENINNNHVVPVDYDTYRQLKNHIAKALVPLLQIWLYATAQRGVFEKRYDELCQHLNIQHYAYASQIRQALGPALDELVAFGYLSAWRLEELAGERAYKLVLEHGPKYYQDRRLRMGRKSPPARLRIGRPGDTNAPLPAAPVRRAGKLRAKPERVKQDALALPLTEDTAPAPAAAAPVPVAAIAPPAAPAPLASPPAEAAAPDADTAAALALVARFYTLRYGQPQEATPRELAQAQELLAQDEAQAAHLIEFAASEGRDGGKFPNDFGGVTKMAAQAGAEFRRARKRQAQGQSENASRTRQEAFWEGYTSFLVTQAVQDFQTAFPADFTAFVAEEERQRKFHRARADKSRLSADIMAAFDTTGGRANRLLHFRERRPDCGIPTFAQWDAQHNVDRPPVSDPSQPDRPDRPDKPHSER